MNPEIRQQLYGGEITDYYPASKHISPEQDLKNISNIYQQNIIDKNKNFNLPDALKNKVQILKNNIIS